MHTESEVRRREGKGVVLRHALTLSVQRINSPDLYVATVQLLRIRQNSELGERTKILNCMSYNVHTTQQGIRNKLTIYKYIT